MSLSSCEGHLAATQGTPSGTVTYPRVSTGQRWRSQSQTCNAVRSHSMHLQGPFITLARAGPKDPRRPRLWHGNIFKAIYWAMVGRPDKLAAKVAKTQQQLIDIQSVGFPNTGEDAA